MSTAILEEETMGTDLPTVSVDLEHCTSHDLSIDFETFFGVEPRHVSPSFRICLSDLSYQPKIDRPIAAWAPTTAPFIATIGTGSGTEAVAALEVFFPALSSITMTDLSPKVVSSAKSNLIPAVHDAGKVVQAVAMEATALTGDCLEPLQGQQPWDLIYVNLPNIPLPEGAILLEEQMSSTYFSSAQLPYRVPPLVSSALLDLHYTCLIQARILSLHTPDGVVLSSMGGRVPIATMLALADTAGYSGRILSMAWKVQSEPNSVIEGYATQQRRGLGPFYFYRTTALQRIFHGRTPAGAAPRALQIEQELLSERIDAEEIGHPAVVMASVRK
ncbi:uncharacterized protein BO97DRAFT_433804 [Aspergillus homomorphus CBS 101889]|uniref:Methyltransferase domain-containing protein n=1 Tax=Aspergillus homomorphus (strain CBS 101889) TaxID=1450537 RepID=A0A395HYN5_ASPHC|nr:hypothetical protein BO97DRAFT_433804 [Aspergillus homomorphus CBS 101889]RAL13052.1 hypothetical protein BO97DRAFT_433804 [Aspergillus homomorphus CBS 101889]